MLSHFLSVLYFTTKFMKYAKTSNSNKQTDNGKLFLFETCNLIIGIYLEFGICSLLFFLFSCFMVFLLLSFRKFTNSTFYYLINL